MYSSYATLLREKLSSTRNEHPSPQPPRSGEKAHKPSPLATSYIPSFFNTPRHQPTNTLESEYMQRLTNDIATNEHLLKHCVGATVSTLPYSTLLEAQLSTLP